MEALATILTSSNSWVTIMGLIALICLLAYFSKKGIFSFKGKGLVVGNGEKQLTIISRQIEYSKAELEIYFEDMIRKYSSFEWFNKDRCLMCKEIVYDNIVEAIALNHITKDDFYCKGKMIKVWAELSKQPLSPAFTSDEFREECQKELTKIIYNLVDIKVYYNNEK